MEDVNKLIHLAHQSGILDRVNQIMPNASKCLTRSAVEENNFSQNHKRVLEMNDIYGMLTILSIGLGVALLVFTIECITYKTYSKKGSKDIGRSKQAKDGHKTKRKGARGRKYEKHNKTPIQKIDNLPEVIIQ